MRHDKGVGLEPATAMSATNGLP